MVADNIDAAVAIAAADQSSSAVVCKEELPAGNYILVGVDIDTTGRRLIDEVRPTRTSMEISIKTRT